MPDIEVRSVSPDMISAWKDLAREAESLFRSVMAEASEFRDFMESSISRHEAFAAVEQPSGKILGIIAVSRENNEIAWMVVAEDSRGRGAGSKLLEKAIRELDEKRDISVITFLESDSVGLPARKMYLKYGFRDVGEECVYDGHPRCLMVRASGIF